jgi:hypothetical protein
MRRWLAVAVLAAAVACGDDGTQSVEATCKRLAAAGATSDSARLRDIAADADESIRPALERLATATETADAASARGPSAEINGRCAEEGVSLPQ